MKPNRLMQIILLVLLVIFVAAGAFVYMADSKEKDRYQAKADQITQQQAILTRGLAQKVDKEKEALDLAAQLAAAKASVAGINFLSSAESIEYNRILFSMVEDAKLTCNGIATSPPANFKDGATTYQVTTFILNLAGLTPTKIFQTPADSQSYIDSTVGSILSFLDALSASPDFDTAAIELVNIGEPVAMTAQEIEAMNSAINDIVADEITEAEKQVLTPDEITKLIADKLAAKSADQIKLLIEKVGVTKPTAVITIKIWTYKGV